MVSERSVARYHGTQEVIREKALCSSFTCRPFVGKLLVKQQHLLDAWRDGFVTWGRDAASKYNWHGFPASIRGIHFPPHNLPIVHTDSCLVWQG